jgi:hypothetical protein
VGLPLVLALSFVFFGALANHHYPIADWLFLRYGTYAACALLFVLACFSSGHLVVRRVLAGRVLPIYEHLAVAFAAGIYVFFLGVYLGGLLGLFGGVFFFALPVVLIAAGARPSFRYARRALRHVRAARARGPAPSPWGLAVHAFALLGLGLVYFAILTPNNTAFDSRWQHLGIAEHYAAIGAVRKFPEGWFIGAAPHLASFLYTWAFLLPRGGIADHIELAAHVELAVFAVALVGIPALVRRLVRPRAVGPNAHRWAWAARFLFPGIFLYDSSLCLGADHIASAFAVPVYLLLLRAWKDLAPRYCVLLALAMTGALLTKYTGALLLVAPALVALPLRGVWLGIRTLRKKGEPLPPRTWWAGPVAALAAGVVFFAPHWVKNLVWYGDPLYPVLHARFAPRPWTPDSATRFDVGLMSLLWRPERSLKGVGQTLGALFTFSFIPNDWEKFHGSTPVFGSLFTFSLAMLPFLKGTRRVWALFAATHLGVFIWYWTHHQDRYLQAVLPWMAAATAAVLALAWKQGIAARIGIGALVALQIVWGADVYLMPGHAMIGLPAKAVIEILSRTPGKPAKDRIAYTDGLVGVGKALPKGAKVLVHEFHPRLGLGAAVTDCPYHQGGISYARTPTARQVWEQLHDYGVTHLIYRTGQPREPDTVAGEIVFYDFVQHATSAGKTVEGWQLHALDAAPPPAGNPPDPVLVWSCGKHLKPGLYHLDDLRVPALEKGKAEPKPFVPAGADPAALLDQAKAVAQVIECSNIPKAIEASFTRLGHRDPYYLWVRR